MARLAINRSVGMLVLAIFLILYGLTTFVALALPPVVLGALALVAGVLILVGR